MAQPNILALERKPFFVSTLWKRNLYLSSALILDLLVLAFVACLHVDTKPHEGSFPLMSYHVYLAVNRWTSYFWLFILLGLQIWLSHRALINSLDGAGMINLYPDDKSGGRRFGGFTGKTLAEMVHELARKIDVGPIKRIVVSERPDPNAYTAYVLGHGNIVVLHSNLLDILSPEGVRAIVAHEVGHVRRWDSLVYLLAGLPRSFVYLMGAFILWKIGVGIFQFETFGMLFERLVFLSLVWSASMWVLVRLERIANMASQQSEHLADAYAAEAVGWQPTLNALLLLGERGEALHVLINELKKLPYVQEEGLSEETVLPILERLPVRELDEKRIRQAAPRLYIESQLAQLKKKLCVPLGEEEIINLATRAEKALKQKLTEEKKEDEEKDKEQKEEEKKQAELEKLLIDWRKFDWDHSGHLDPEETAALMEELKKDPKKMIFRQFLEEDADWESHPTTRRRLMYLYEAFEQEKAK